MIMPCVASNRPHLLFIVRRIPGSSSLIMEQSSKRPLPVLPVIQYSHLPVFRCFSYYHGDTRFIDRMEMLRQQELILRKTATSEQLLGLRDVLNNPLPYTITQLRTAYFQAAKLCHPDSQSSSNKRRDTDTSTLLSSDDSPEERFIAVTNAYEYLRQRLPVTGTTKSDDSSTEDDDVLTDAEEEDKYRRACFEYLGQPAEIVEESKRCPLFRQWLFGRTDAAYYWQSFFMMHGGLAPQLRKSDTPQTLLSDNKNTTGTGSTGNSETSNPRRRRPQQR